VVRYVFDIIPKTANAEFDLGAEIESFARKLHKLLVTEVYKFRGDELKKLRRDQIPLDDFYRGKYDVNTYFACGSETRTGWFSWKFNAADDPDPIDDSIADPLPGADPSTDSGTGADAEAEAGMAVEANVAEAEAGETAVAEAAEVEAEVEAEAGTRGNPYRIASSPTSPHAPATP
jgi:hypothetical protein